MLISEIELGFLRILIYFTDIMTEDMDAKQILEWYILAGVEETSGNEPFAKVEAAPVVRVATSVLKPQAVSETRQATTALSQATQNACQNAREQCKNAKTLAELKQLVEIFDGCALKLTATNTVFGDGDENARIVFIGEAPGADEDRIGKPFVGRSGQLLDKMLSAAGLDRASCFITNILPWRPPGNRTPTDGEIAVCLPFLKRQISLIKPDYLFIMGGSAANAILDIQDSISRLRGHWLEYIDEDGRKIPALASFHPAYLLRNSGQKAKSWVDFLRLKQRLFEDENKK